MTAAALASALIGFERQDGYPADPSDLMEWSNHSPELRYRWAALAALEESDAAAAGVFAQLAVAVATESVGIELFVRRNED